MDEFIIVVGIVVFMLWYTRDEPAKGKLEPPTKRDFGPHEPNRRADGSIPGQMRGWNPGEDV